MLIWQAGRRGGKTLRHGDVKWLARGNNAAHRTSDLSLSLQSLSKVFTSLSRAESLQVLVHTSHQPSVHLIPPSCPLLLSVPPTFANGLFTLASCLANILSIPYLPFQKLCSLPGGKEWLHAIFPCPSCTVAIIQHTQISVWIANCYSASTVNSGCLGQACSQKRSLLSVLLKINNQRKGKGKSSSCPKEMSTTPQKTKYLTQDRVVGVGNLQIKRFKNKKFCLCDADQSYLLFSGVVNRPAHSCQYSTAISFGKLNAAVDCGT